MYRVQILEPYLTQLFILFKSSLHSPIRTESIYTFSLALMSLFFGHSLIENGLFIFRSTFEEARAKYYQRY